MDSNSLLILTFVALIIGPALIILLVHTNRMANAQGELKESLCTATSDVQQKLFSAQEQPGNATGKNEKEPDAETVPVAGNKNIRDLIVLLVEDNVINKKIGLMSLKKKVKRIDLANNGKEALDMFALEKYDLVLMDIQMPVMDGITATKKIRETESTPERRVPIIAITANTLAVDRDQCLAAGADDYLSKPYQMEELLNKIQALL